MALLVAYCQPCQMYRRRRKLRTIGDFGIVAGGYKVFTLHPGQAAEPDVGHDLRRDRWIRVKISDQENSAPAPGMQTSGLPWLRQFVIAAR
jgi:hypothetical protein